MNALRHGLYASTVLLPEENPQEYDALRLLYQERLEPKTTYEQELVSQIAQIEWKRIRTELIAVLRRDRNKLREQLERVQSARRKEASTQHPEPGEQSEPDDERWATKEEFLTQTGREKNFKQAKFFEIWWTPVPGEPEKLLARLYKGKNVDEWPADDQPDPGEVWIRRKP